MKNKRIKKSLEQKLKNILKVDLSVMDYDNRFGTLNIQVCFQKNSGVFLHKDKVVLQDTTQIHYSKLAKRFFVFKNDYQKVYFGEEIKLPKYILK